MKVRVKFAKSPIKAYGLARSLGDYAMLDVELAKKIREEHPDMIISPELDEILKPKEVIKKVRTRPVTREKGN